jgi:hypothetical protein
MNEMQTTVERHFQLSPERARRLDSLARTRGVGESQIVENALDILFSLADLFDPRTEWQGWSFFSEATAQHIWGHEMTTAYADAITQQAPLRNHSAFLKGYAPEDEGLYDGYPSR